MTQIGKKVLAFIQENFKFDEEKELAEFINNNIESILEICDIREEKREDFIDNFC